MPRRFLTPIELPADAASALHAVPKQQLDAGIATRAAATHAHPLTPFELTDATTVLVNMNNGAYQRLSSMAGNRTLGSPSNSVDGSRLLLEVIPGATARVLTLSANYILMPGAGTATVNIPANKRWFAMCLFSGTVCYMLTSAIQP